MKPCCFSQAETVLESVDWLNCLLRILWRNVYEPKFALQLCSVLQKKLSKSRPKFMVSSSLSDDAHFSTQSPLASLQEILWGPDA